jgi:hypothetical protein
MTTKPSRSIEVFVESGCDWLWTWSGACFGYRRQVSLFTHDGLEVGRFCGADIHGPDGWYIGEIITAEDGPRLITNVYKKTRVRAPFTPDSDRPQRRLEARVPEPLFVGHEDFPSPEIAKRQRHARPEFVAS